MTGIDHLLADVESRGILLCRQDWEVATAEAEERLASLRAAEACIDRFDGWTGQIEKLQNLRSHLFRLHDRSLDGRIRCAWTVPGGGRIFSRSPNLQGVPRRLRWAFHAAPGHRLVLADVENAQLRIAAAQSGDPLLLEDTAPSSHLYTCLQDRLALHDLPEGLSRGFWKGLAIRLMNGAGEPGIGRLLAENEVDLKSTSPRSVIDAWRGRYSVWEAYIRGLEGERAWTTPLGRYVQAQPGTQVAASYLQSIESDVLRAVLLLQEKWFPGLPAPILLMHDGLVWEVPEQAADRMAQIAEALITDAFQAVTGVPVSGVEVVTSPRWGQRERA